MKNPRQEQTNRLANSMGYLMAYDFTHDPERNPEIAKPKSDLEFALDVAFPKRHLNKVLTELKKKMLSSVDIPGSIAENKLERIKGNVMLAYAKEMKRPVRFAKQGECQYTMDLEKEKVPKVSKSEDDFEICLSKSIGVLNYSELPEHRQKIAYIKGIYRNKFDDYRNNIHLALVNFYEAGGDLDYAMNELKSNSFRSSWQFIQWLNN